MCQIMQTTKDLQKKMFFFSVCDKTLLGEKLKTGTCLEFYELQDLDIKPESLVTIRSRKQRKEKESIESKSCFTICNEKDGKF